MIQLTDARSLAAGEALSADLCIVGAGSAGLTLAAALAGSSKRVLLLEAEERDTATERLDVRFGPCRRLRVDDLERRGWVCGSGWPLGLDDLAPYYEQVERWLAVDGPLGNSRPLPLAACHGFEGLWARYPRRTQAAALGGALDEANNIHLLTGALVTEFELTAGGDSIHQASVQTTDGTALTVTAGRFVLAAGAVDGPRLLLASNRRRASGLGNGTDRVGRYLMEPYRFTVGSLVVPRLRRAMNVHSLRRKRTRSYHLRALLEPSSALQRRHELLRSTLSLRPLRSSRLPKLAGEVRRLTDSIAGLTEASPAKGTGNYYGAVTLATEAVAHRDSHVTLGTAVDRAGRPVAAIDRRWTDHEIWSVKATTQRLAESLGRSLLGRLHTHYIGEESQRLKPSGELAGTTRMGADPASSVVDPDCRVHDVENLWVTGASVFPTSGPGEQALTVMALAVRLAEHLRRR